MKQLPYAFLLLLITAVTACDTARYPIDPVPSVRIDNRLLGNWKVKGKHEEFTVIRHTDYSYLVLYRNRRHDDIDKYPAFISMIDSIPFLNISSMEDSAAGFTFIKIIEVNTIKNVVTVAAVSDSTLKYITDPTEIRERLSKNLNNPAFYSDTTYFFRLR